MSVHSPENDFIYLGKKKFYPANYFENNKNNKCSAARQRFDKFIHYSYIKTRQQDNV